MEKNEHLHATLDATSASVLRQIAEKEAESNQSLALRLLLREAGARRGLLNAPAKSVQSEVKHGA